MTLSPTLTPHTDSSAPTTHHVATIPCTDPEGLGVRNTGILKKRIFPGQMVASSVELSLPKTGIVFDGLVLRLPTTADLDRMPPDFADLDALTRADFAELVPQMTTLVASGRLVPLVVCDVETGEILGGGTFRHFDPKGAIIEIGYWLYPHARGRGVATRTARVLAEHAFGLGIRRVVAHVKVGNSASERVLERAGFTREGISRSMPTADGRIDKTVWSLLPGE
jgi:RimJ/RimL family protein N-acetyltransferase